MATGRMHADDRLGDDLAVRLPRIAGAVAQVELEQRWLPRLEPELPFAIPAPIARGQPGEGYPWPWSVYRWLDGETVAPERVKDMNQLARDLARWIVALRSIAWEAALAAPVWKAEPVWVHGDLHSGNLLVLQGRLSSVIDFGCLGVGDPACDLMVAWNLFDADARAVFDPRWRPTRPAGGEGATGQSISGSWRCPTINTPTRCWPVSPGVRSRAR